jgi:hypothetical protein
MLVREILQDIDAMYPQAFTNEQSRRSWGKAYVSILSPFEGPILAAAWESTMREHTKVAFPKPADILANCHREKSSPNNDSDLIRDWNWIDNRRLERIENWKRQNQETWLEAVQKGFQYQFENALRKKADRAAQQDFIRFKGYTPLNNEDMTISEDEIALICGDLVNKDGQAGKTPVGKVLDKARGAIC